MSALQKKITIAVDGYSSTGKSTLSKQLAEALGYIYVDSGAMYRAITYFALSHGLIGTNFFYKEKLLNLLPSLDLRFKMLPEWNKAHMFLNGIDVEKEIRGLEVSGFVSRIAEIPEVRQKLVSQQQEMGAEKGVVMDGRDIGTVVFPNAELKVFMTASSEIRAQRRYEELLATDKKISYDEVFRNIEERDQIDTTREDSPLVKAVDAVEVDNSHMSVEEQFEVVYQLAISKISSLS